MQRKIESEDEAAQNEWINVYKAPLFLETIRTNELTNQIALTFRHWLPQEKWCEVQIPWADRSQKAVINAMAAANINVPRARERDMLLYIEQAIDSFQNFRKTEMEYATYGWRGDYDAFLVGSELYKRGSAAHTIVGVSEELRIRGAYMRAFGTYDDWRAAAQPLFAHEQQGFMVVAGFASTLMRFVNEAASAIIAAVSPEPRLGKSMGLIAARSIWGDDKSIDIGINDTTNSRFKMLALLNGLPATWDDMRKKDDPEVIKQFIHSFSQGRDKNRLDKSGNLRANISGWASILLVTSNISISELVGYDGETAQQARVLEYRFNRMEGIQFSDGMAWERQLRANRGTAGRRWVQVLMMPGVIEYLLTAIPTTVKRLEQRLGTSSASFYASMLACIVVASELLNRYGMLEFSTKRILEFGIRAAENAVTYMNETLRTPSGVVTQLINDSWDNALIVHDAFKPKTATLVERQPKARLAMRYEIKTARAFIARDYARGWCRDNNAMFHDIEDKLRAEGVLVAHNRRINLGAGTPFASGQVACWEVDLEHQALGGLKLLKAKEDERALSSG